MRTRYIPEIDGLRAVAVLSVLAYHLHPQWLPGGYSGVDLFFVISGYVVTASLRRDSGQPLGQYLLAFYARRVIRIMPALLVCLMLTTALVVLFIPPSWLSQAIPETGIAAFFGFSNIVLTWQDSYFAPAPEFNPFTHTWSLGVEEQFYLIFPLLLFMAEGWGGSARWRPRITPVLAVASASLLSFALMVAASHGHPDVAFFWLPCRFWELGTGAALCLSGLSRPTGLRAAAGQGAGGLLIAASLIFADHTAFPFPWAIPAVAGAALVIASIPANGSALAMPSRVLATPVLVAIGRISYSLYLWHWVVFCLFRWTIGLGKPTTMAAAVVLSFSLGWLSTRYIENPVRRDRRLRGGPPGSPRGWPHGAVIAAAAILVVGCSGLAWAGFKKQTALSLTSVGRNHAEWFGDLTVAKLSAGGCPMGEDKQTLPNLLQRVHVAPNCGPDMPRLRHLYVLGDSHGEAYAPMLNRAATELDLDVTRYRRSDCSVANLLRPSPPGCLTVEEEALADLLRTSRPGDIVFLAALRMVKLAGPYRALSDAEVSRNFESDPVLQGRQIAFHEASDVIGRLQAAGLIVMIDYPKPVFSVNPFRCADAWTRLNPDCAGGPEIERARLQRMRAPFMEMLGSLKMLHPGIVAFDSFGTLCPNAICRAITEDGPLFIDGDHLTGAANRILYPVFAKVLQSAERAPAD